MLCIPKPHVNLTSKGLFLHLRIAKTLPTFPPTFMPSVMEYKAGGGFGEACAEKRPFGLSTNSRFRSLPGKSPTLNS